MRITEVLRGKARAEVSTIAPDATVRDLVTALKTHNIGALAVSADGHTVEGIVSERDVVRAIAEDERILDAAVSSIMTHQVHTCDFDSEVGQLMRLMTKERVRHVPVVHEGRLRGIISIGDVVKSRIGELEFERDQLDHYLHQT